MDGEARVVLRARGRATTALLALRGRSPGALLVSAETALRVWQPATCAPVRVLDGHKYGVWSLAADPTGQLLLSAGLDHTARLWDLHAGACTRVLETDGALAVAWDAAGRRYAVGSIRNAIHVFDAASGRFERALEGHAAALNALAAHPDPDADRFASASDDDTVRLWRWSAGGCLRVLLGHSSNVMALAASARWLLSGSWDQTVRVWDWDGACARVLDRFAGRLVDLAWRGARMVTLDASGDGCLRVWDTHGDPAAWSCAGALRAAPSARPGLSEWYGVAVLGDGRVAGATAGALALHALRAPRERRGIRRPAARV